MDVFLEIVREGVTREQLHETDGTMGYAPYLCHGVISEGLHAVRALKERFSGNPLVADLKTMDGGYLEAEMMARAGADMVVVMGVAHPATIREV
jgi:hypothetical protein